MPGHSLPGGKYVVIRRTLCDYLLTLLNAGEPQRASIGSCGRVTASHRLHGHVEQARSLPSQLARNLPITPFSREPRDGRCVGPSFRVRTDMADLSKNRVCCGHAAVHFVCS